ncbi:MAG TPA: ABC transporter permease, partial [Pyrinomonadaceae bacterium]|nr:ABC transporter permease [Pyrinomonadaceae bacterium]
MTIFQLVKRNLLFYWRTNLAVVLGVATAVAVLAGALLVGDSVRASLRDLFLQRLGNTSYAIAGNGFFREQLAADIQTDTQFAQAGFTEMCPLIALEGNVTHEASKHRGSGIRVYGVDDRFWKFHRRNVAAPNNDEVFLSESLARELSANTGDSLLLRVEKFSEIPIESLHSQKEDLGSTMRLQVRQILDARALGEFSLQPQQTEVRAVFVSLRRLQEELEQQGKANLILVSENSQKDAQQVGEATLGRLLKEKVTVEDYGLKLRALTDRQTISVESEAGLLPETLAEAVQAAAQSSELAAAPFLSYLVNGIRTDEGREIPYSIVSSVGAEMMEVMQHNESGHMPSCETFPPAGTQRSPTSQLPPILLTEWAGKDLQVKLGERVTLDYYVWLEEGKLATRSAEFRVACIIPMDGLATDRDLVPDYPGISESESLSDWNPPFPIDLQRVRPQDEDYWKKYRTAPKAFVPLEVSQQLWRSRFGQLTSLRVQPKRG